MTDLADWELFERVWAYWGSPRAFRERMRLLMDEWGVSQHDLARRSGFGVPHVNRWLGGKASVAPTMGTMVMLEEALFQIVAERKAHRMAA